MVCPPPWSTMKLLAPACSSCRRGSESDLDAVLLPDLFPRHVRGRAGAAHACSTDAATEPDMSARHSQLHHDCRIRRAEPEPPSMAANSPFDCVLLGKRRSLARSPGRTPGRLLLSIILLWPERSVQTSTTPCTRENTGIGPAHKHNIDEFPQAMLGVSVYKLQGRRLARRALPHARQLPRRSALLSFFSSTLLIGNSPFHF